MRSLQSRLLFSTTLVLGFFLLIAAIILDRNFRANKVNDIVARLSIHIKELMGLVLDKSGKPCEKTFQLRDEGYATESPPRIFAVVINPEAALQSDYGRVIIWQSESTVVKKDSPVPFTEKVIDGQVSFNVESAPNGEKFVAVSYATFLEQVDDCEKYREEFKVKIKDAVELPDPASKIKLAGEGMEDDSEINTQENKLKTKARKVKKKAKKSPKPHKVAQVINLNKKPKTEKKTKKLPKQTKIKPLGDGNVRAIIKISESLDRSRKYYSILRMAFDFDENASLNKDIHDFRVILAIGFIVVIAAYLLLLFLFLGVWGLRPMRQVSIELEKIKSGKLKQLAGDYPKEVLGLTEGINRLIISERARQERFRNSLGDLAHSLKTPLAVLISESEDKTSKENWQQSVKEQVDRMRQIITYQLEKAVVAGKTSLANAVSVNDVVMRIINTLTKVYIDKNIEINCTIDSKVIFVGDEGDLLEILGNLMENASKWCNHKVLVSAKNTERNGENILECVIEDDGPGIPEDKIEQVQNRGFRADEAVAGQGIGLAVVKEIVHVYKGVLEIQRSPLGGAKFIIKL